MILLKTKHVAKERKLMSKITYNHGSDVELVALSDNENSFGVIIESGYKDFLDAKMSLQSKQVELTTAEAFKNEKLAIKNLAETDYNYLVTQVNRHESILITEQNYIILLASANATLAAEQAILDGMVEGDDPAAYAEQQAIVAAAQVVVDDILAARAADVVTKSDAKDAAQAQYDSDIVLLNTAISDNAVALQTLTDAQASLTVAVLDVENYQNTYNTALEILNVETATLAAINPVTHPTEHAEQQAIVDAAQIAVNTALSDLDAAEVALINAQNAETSAEDAQAITQVAMEFAQAVVAVSSQALDRSIADLDIVQNGVATAETYLDNFQTVAAISLVTYQSANDAYNQAVMDFNLVTAELANAQNILDANILANVIVPAGQIMLRVSEGLYEYEFEDPSNGLSYLYVIKIGETYQTLVMDSPSILEEYYVTLDYFEDYIKGCVNSEFCQDIESSKKIQAASAATRIIDRLNYIGEKVSADQIHEFPRLDQTEVPQTVKAACCEIMLSLLDGIDIDYEFEKLGTTSQKYANIKTTYKDTRYSAHIMAGVPSILAWKLLMLYVDYSSDLSIDLCRVN